VTYPACSEELDTSAHVTVVGVAAGVRRYEETGITRDMGSGNESVGLAQSLVVGDAKTDDTAVRVSGCEQGDSFSLIARCAPAHSQQEAYPDAGGSSRVMARVDHDLHRLVQAAHRPRRTVQPVC